MDIGIVTTVIWLLVIVGVILFELWTVWKFGDGAQPLTQVYLRLSCKKWFRILIFPFFSWMLWHWIIQPYFWEGYIWVDFVFILLGLIVGWKIHPPKNMVNCE